jgi:5-(hydroxymethyl)furfural/furfural oxidase
MGMLALRGVPSDYLRWAEAGVEGLTWENARQHFRKFEAHEQSRPGAAMGSYPIRTLPSSQWPGFVKAMQDVAVRMGYPRVEDINEQPGDGFFSMPNSQSQEARSSTARCYLTGKVRERRNLLILPETVVLRLLFDGETAIGIEVYQRGETRKIFANRVVVSAGGIHSPALLMRSGIGPAAALRRLGIEVVADRPGVGRNLQNHSYAFFSLTLKSGSRMSPSERQFAVAGLRASSKLADCPPADLFIYLTGRVSARSFGTDVALVAASLYSPFSTGVVSLESADPLAHPRIDFRMLSDPRDPPRVVMVGRLAETLLREPAVAGCYHEAALLPPALALNQFNRSGWMGSAFAMGAKVAVNAPRPVRRAAMRIAFPGAKLLAPKGRASTLVDQDLLAAISPMGHPVGTCAMGRTTDPMTVVDSDFCVLGASNLYVVDASVMPSVPSANTNLPTVMLAERAAQRLLEQR